MEEEKICKLVMQKWEALKEIVSCLKVLYQATIVIQKEDFKLSDFYATWIYIDVKLKKNLQKQNITNLSKHLIEMLEKRKPQIIMNPAVISALALDPRFCYKLDDIQKEIAITNLLNLWNRLKHDTLSAESLTLNDTNNSSDEDITIGDTTILSNFIKRLESQKSTVIQTFEIREALSSFMTREHEVPNGTILDFWLLKKNEYPELYELAEIIMAISPTQAVVERAFSALSYTFNSRRNSLSEQMIDDILLISLNKDLFYANNEKDLASCK